MKTTRFQEMERSVAGEPAPLAVSADKPSEPLAGTEQEIKEAREYAEAIIQAVPPLLVLDADLRVKTANESFYKHFRVSPPQTENCLVYELGNGQWNIPKLRTFLEEILPRHSFFKDFEVTHDFEGIGRRTILLSAHQVDHIQRILLFIDDITERVESRAAMRASEIRYRRLFEAARDGILIVDPETRKIRDANPFMSELLGYRREELLGKELWEIGLLKDEDASRVAFRELQRKHFIRYEDLPLQTKAGQRREVEFVSNQYPENGHEVIQCNIRDITARKGTEDALRRAKERLDNQAAELERLVSERTAQLAETVGELQAFSYSVGHDLRAPLRAMQGFAQRVVDDYSGKLDEQAINHLQWIMRSAIRLDRLIQDVLSYTKILHAEAPMKSVDLDTLVRDITKAYAGGQPPQAHVHIQGTLPKVLGNEGFLTQSISNLLSNAVKFVSPGVQPRLELWAEEAPFTEGNRQNKDAISSSPLLPSLPSIRICIRDNGIGIASENHARIFRMFERIHPPSVYEGTGVGLTIARKAAERTGGQIGFESELGKGSKFWIQLVKG